MYKKQIKVLEQIKNLEVINAYKVQSVIINNSEFNNITMLSRPTGWGGSKFIIIYHDIGFYAYGDTAATYINTNVSLYNIEVKRQKDLSNLIKQLDSIGFIDLDSMPKYVNKTTEQKREAIDDLIKQLKQDL